MKKRILSWANPLLLFAVLLVAGFQPAGNCQGLGKSIRRRRPRTLVAHRDVVSSLAFSPDGKLVASGHHDAGILVWDVQTGERKQTLMGGAFGEIQALAYAPGGSTLASGGHNHTLKLWDAQTGKLKGTLRGHRDTVTSIAFSPDGSLMASGSTDKTVKLWDARTWTLRQTFYAPNRSLVYSLAFTPDGKQLAAAVGNYDMKYGAIVMWDVGQ